MATTDFHSNFDDATPLLAHLSATRPDTLIVDSGDFFEGTGYYRIGRGYLERATLLALYDVIAPGNHGWQHYFETDLHRITVCANAYGADGRRLFRPVDIRRIGGRTVGVTGVLGHQAFNAIPYAERAGQHVTNPAHALRELRLAHEEVESWAVLSHSGFEEDLLLADACPFLDLVFAGHCHGDQYGPVQVGGVNVLKGYELGAGFAYAEPSEDAWTARVLRFDLIASSPPPDGLEAVRAQVSSIARELAAGLGIVAAPYRRTTLNRRSLLTDIIARLGAGRAADAVLLNETALRTVQLNDVLTYGDLLAVEPFGNQLVRTTLPERFRSDPASLMARLTEHAGPMASAPDPLTPRLHTVLTTGYLADAIGVPADATGPPLAQLVRQALTQGVGR
jgi:2',3'-cyclic-nucleotide 2'-phosphodiesterase (5'-nucleotidase family)